MRKSLVLVLLLPFFGFAVAQQNPAPNLPNGPAPKAAPDNSPLKTQKDRVSYAIGLNLGANLRRDSIEIDPSVLLQGMKDALTGSKGLMSDEEIRATFADLQTQVQAVLAAKRQQAAATNKREGEVFLATNKTKPGVVTLPSGLQYKILTAGTGPKPTASDTVVCNYRGTFINGTEFDSSYQRGEATTFSLGGVIPGWTEAIQLMPTGSKWQLFVPSALAYGEPGREGIEPNTTLIFEVELLSIQGKQ